jgi:hypothetical protein
MKQFSSNESRLSRVFEIFFGVVAVEVFFFWLVAPGKLRKEHDPRKVAEVYLSNS